MSINEKELVKQLENINRTFIALHKFLCEEVLTGSQSERLSKMLREASNNLTNEEQEKKNNKHIKDMGEFFKKMEENEKSKQGELK